MVAVAELKFWELAGEEYQRWYREGWVLERKREEKRHGKWRLKWKGDLNLGVANNTNDPKGRRNM